MFRKKKKKKCIDKIIKRKITQYFIFLRIFYKTHKYVYKSVESKKKKEKKTDLFDEYKTRDNRKERFIRLMNFLVIS